MGGRVDLHVHTTISDGLHTPSEIVAMARAEGLGVIAVTDHDAVDGVAEALAAAAGTDLEVIPGVEISTDAAALEIHILGYWVDHTDPQFVRALARFSESRSERARTILHKLRKLGVYLSWERVQALAGGGVVGRPHIARAMQEAAYVHSAQEAFDRYLSRGKPAYAPRYKVTPIEAIHLIHQARGVAVLAHPWQVTFVLPELAAEGLAGLEAYYTGYGPGEIAHLRQLARSYGLVCTGGSDFHGLALLPENRLGQVWVPERSVEALRARKRAHDAARNARL